MNSPCVSQLFLCQGGLGHNLNSRAWVGDSTQPFQMRLWTESEAWNAAEIYCGLILAALIAWCLAISATLGKETGQRMQPDCGDKINSAQTSNGTLTILAGKCTKYESHFSEIPLLKNKDIFSFQIWASILCGLSRVHIVWWTCQSFIKKFRNGLTGEKYVSSEIVAPHLKYQTYGFSPLMFIRQMTGKLSK